MNGLDAVTRRLKGRGWVKIDRVTGVPGRAPEIVLIWSDGTTQRLSFPYDNMNEYFDQLASARDHAATYSKTHDIEDNTL